MLLDAFLDRSAESSPDKTAIVCRAERWTYRQVHRRACAVANNLLAHGVRRGDRVVIALENCPETVVALFGALKAGAAFIAVNPQIRPERLVYVLNHSGARVLIARPRQVVALQHVWSELTHLQVVVIAGADGAASVPDALAALNLNATMRPGGSDHESLSQRRSPADLAAVIYTSGSTGAPKGVMLTHHNMTSAAASICSYLENTPDDVILNALPISFTYGLGQITTGFSVGATIVLEPSFAYPQAVIDTMARERVTGVPLVPTMATLLLQQGLEMSRVPHLRYVTNAAAALSVPKIQRLRELLPPVQLYSMYGLTECQRVSFLPPAEIDTRPGSVGIAIPGTRVAVVDEQGRAVPPDTTGELIVSGPHVMVGYWNDPEATGRILRPGRTPDEIVLRTGDLFRTDADGRLYFVERKDDIIKTRGEKVAPRTVEAVIAAMPEVAEVAVYGVPHDVLGEAVAAAVIPAAGAVITSERIRQHCRRHLDDFMVPSIIEVRDAVPTTMSGKVSRRELRALTTHREGSSA